MLHGPQASAALGPPPGTRRMLAGGVLHVPQGPPSHFPVHPQKEGWMPPPPLMGQQERRFPRGTTGASPRPRDTAKTPLPGTLPPRTHPPPYPTGGRVGGPDPPTRFPRGAPRLSRARGPHRLPGRSGGGGGGAGSAPPLASLGRRSGPRRPSPGVRGEQPRPAGPMAGGTHPCSAPRRSGRA